MYPPAMESQYLFCFIDVHRIPDGGKKAKFMIRSFLTKMFKKIEFQEDEENAKQMLLGSHNIRKKASTYCRTCGIHNDEKDIRAVTGEEKVVCQMYTTMLSCRIQMQRLRLFYVEAALVFM
jgi:hypothetical protein